MIDCLGRVAAAVLIWLAAWEVYGAESKPIYLRGRVIEPMPSKGPEYQARSLEPAVSGLYLVQFKGAFQSVWRDQLRALRVDLLRSIPEDAFVAQFDAVRISALKALPFVNWVGEYRADYKVHSQLRIPREKLNAIPVNVLLSAKISPMEAARVRQTLQNIRFESQSRFGVVMQGELNEAGVGILAQSSSVLWMEPAGEPRMHDEIASRIVGGSLVLGGSNQPSAPLVGTIPVLDTEGLGVTIAVADSGLDTGNGEGIHPDLAGRVAGFLHYGGLSDASDEHGHGTHVAGIIAGNGATGERDETGHLYGLGVAPRSRIVVQRIFDRDGRYEGPSNLEELTRDATRAGATIGSHSWGDDTQGRYDVNAMEYDALVRDADSERPGDQPYLIVCSAGNAGPAHQTVGSPAVAKNVLATGASQNERRDFVLYAEGKETMADFSSRGPTEDGRVKPDLVAPGTWIASLQSSRAGDQNAWLPISPRYFYLGGTSQAAPQAAGAAALFVEYYRQRHGNLAPSPALIKAALINLASDMDNSSGTAAVPNLDEGWGRVNVSGLGSSKRAEEFIDQTEVLSTGQSYQKRFLVATDRQPLKVTMVYTDVPGMPAAIPALVNDLDLEVIAPDGRVYRGNQFHNGQSVSGSLDSDRVNNVEAVHLRNPIPGEYAVRIRAVNVMEDARRDTEPVDQDFAVVVSGDLPRSGHGIILTDRNSYSAPDRIHLKLIDSDLAGQESVSVLVRSLSERLGEAVILRPSSSMGVFTGSVDTVVAKFSGPGGPPIPELLPPSPTNSSPVIGALEVLNADSIEILYEDQSPAGTRRTAVLADLTGPVISEVGSTNRFAKTMVTWQTSEPASSVVYFGTHPTNLTALAQPGLALRHEVVLDKLAAGATYFFSVSSMDEAGNLTASTNVYTFVPQTVSSVLLVDAYKSDGLNPDLPLSGYTAPLDEIGVTYDLWNVAEAGSPEAVDLRPYRAVLWRVSDSVFADNPLTLPQQIALQQYVQNGGSIFMASMELLSRLGNVAFRTNVLQVARFETKADLFDDCPECDQDAGVPGVVGAPFDQLMGGMAISLDYSSYPQVEELDWGPDFGDTFTATAAAQPIFVHAQTGKTVGIRYPKQLDDRSGRVVFLSFPLEAVPAGGPSPHNRAGLLRNVLSFLSPGIDGLGSLSFDRTVYTIPGRITIELADSDLVGRGEATVRIFSTSTPAGVTLKLVETIRPGLFRGSTILTGVDQVPVTGQLGAQQGDRLWAEYMDGDGNAGGGVIRAAAEIDMIRPGITGVSAIPYYETATVTWETTEPADALVQFGESVFLGRTAYQGELSGRHQLMLSGLKPNRVYYYQLVSRDAAGNALLDDNQGKLYTFRTLKPMSTPWSDGMEDSGTNWLVLDGAEGTTRWEVGVPDTARPGMAPTRAWGSNISGSAIEFGDTRLISPAIDLSSGNRATLRFWHNYDFTERSELDVYEHGKLSVSTDNGVTWHVIGDYKGTSGGWKPVELDLSAYAGRVIRLSWYYGLFSLEREARPGWLVDEVSLVSTNLVTGSVQVTSNLSQGSCNVTGPVSGSGAGLFWVLMNAPAGEYTIEFKEVPYYETPAPQTHKLNTPGSIQATVEYTFVDLNRNRISDAWEREFFGGISELRTLSTDSDADGLSDLAEFLAGTNPVNPESRLQFSSIAPGTDGTITLSWSCVPGRAYRIQSRQEEGPWVDQSKWQRAASIETTWSFQSSRELPMQFFRLEARP